MNKQGRLLGLFLIILGIIAIVTIGAIIIFKDKEPQVVIPQEVIDYSKLKGCDTEKGMVWCTINNICIDPRTTKCEKTTVSDGYGCIIGTETFCASTQKCHAASVACPPGEYVPPPVINETKPIVTPPVVNTTPVNNNTVNQSTPTTNVTNTTKTNTSG